MVTPDVFISYKREERERCIEIYEKLRALKLEVWFDARLDPGTRFDDEIEAAIRAARAVLVLWSPAAARSEWIRNEATVGKSRNVLSSAFIQPVALPIAFLSTQTEDLSEPHFRDDAPGWLSTLRRVGSLVERPGLEDFSRLLARPDAEGFKQWAVRWPQDPLAAEAWQRAEQLAVDETRARLTREREHPAAGPRGSSPRPTQAAVEPSSQPSWVQRVQAWQWLAGAAGMALIVWLAIPNPPVAPPESTPPGTGATAGEEGSSLQSGIAAPQVSASPEPAPAPTHQLDEREALAAARRALQEIAQRDWGVLRADQLISRVTRVAPFDAVRALANQGEARAQVVLGFATEYGLNGVDRDVDAAISLYAKAAEQGNATAQAYLGSRYSEGAGSLPRNDAEAVRLFQASAAQGHPLGQTRLAVMTEAGRGGLTRSETEAARLYQSAAVQGSAVAQANLGHMHETGRGGIPKDERQALNLYRLAADQGNAYAQSALGVFHRDALGGLVQNDEEAVRLFRIAADQGDSSAKAKLGYMYDTGRGGLAKDHAQALHWYRLAAKQGDPWAQNELRRLGETF